MKHVTIYTDGACSGNPGRGGYGIILAYGDIQKELSAGYRKTTNNRMELLAVIRALQALKEPCAVTLYSDSKYVIDAIRQGWALAWQKNGWRRKTGKAQNPDLWEVLLALLDTHNVTCVWVKGHAENEFNNRCDALAVAASQGETLLVDDVYEKTSALS